VNDPSINKVLLLLLLLLLYYYYCFIIILLLLLLLLLLCKQLEQLHVKSVRMEFEPMIFDTIQPLTPTEL